MLGDRTFAAIGATPGTQSTADTQLADLFLISLSYVEVALWPL